MKNIFSSKHEDDSPSEPNAVPKDELNNTAFTPNDIPTTTTTLPSHEPAILRYVYTTRSCRQAHIATTTGTVLYKSTTASTAPKSPSTTPTPPPPPPPPSASTNGPAA